MDSALISAAFGVYFEIVQLLLEKGANMNLVEDTTHGTALQAASCSGHYRVVQLLLEKGADINIKGVSDGTALQAAAKNGHKVTPLQLRRQ
ncbi:ankyrin repeat-containing domain protein [Mycena olivaceomarginata]|nr:ankyrin repeat-containing domain protein [Mycena olivaceomarginata]